MFYTVLVRDKAKWWTVRKVYTDPRSATSVLKEVKSNGEKGVIVKTDTIKHISKACDRCNAGVLFTPKRSMLDFTVSGIAAARLLTTS